MKIPRGKFIGERVGGLPAHEAEHFIKCPACGGWIDMRDLGSVFDHEGPLPHPGQDSGTTGRSKRSMPIEIYRGHVLDPDQMEALRVQLENFDSIQEVDAELRGIIERNWPHLIAKLPPDDV